MKKILLLTAIVAFLASSVSTTVTVAAEKYTVTKCGDEKDKKGKKACCSKDSKATANKDTKACCKKDAKAGASCHDDKKATTTQSEKKAE